MIANKFLNFLAIYIFTISNLRVDGSRGDRSFNYSKCLYNCEIANCTTKNQLSKYEDARSIWLGIVGWDCSDDCKYTCMWITLVAFEQDKSPVPQFYGKWPFIRWFGLQEPASVIFSLLNLFSQAFMFNYFRKKIRPSNPMYFIWTIYAVLSCNAWFWSAIYHSKDTPFTEKLDYFSAYLIVLYVLFSFIMRLTISYSFVFRCLIFISFLVFYIHHIHYLANVIFDYGYNMKVNLITGIFNFSGWILWALYNRKTHKYGWKAALSVIMVMLVLSLEVLDFPPIFWVFDAHSIWHFATIPIAIPWYSFLVDDCRYLQRNSIKIE